MDSPALYWAYLVVMAASLACFFKAYAVRKHTSSHRKWAGAGVILTLAGIGVVVLAYRIFDWQVAQRFPEVIWWHRRLAYLATALVVFMAVSGALRWPIHKQMYRLFFPVYIVTLALAIIGYKP